MKLRKDEIKRLEKYHQDIQSLSNDPENIKFRQAVDSYINYLDVIKFNHDDDDSELLVEDCDNIDEFPGYNSYNESIYDAHLDEESLYETLANVIKKIAEVDDYLQSRNQKKALDVFNQLNEKRKISILSLDSKEVPIVPTNIDYTDVEFKFEPDHYKKYKDVKVEFDSDGQGNIYEKKFDSNKALNPNQLEKINIETPSVITASITTQSSNEQEAQQFYLFNPYNSDVFESTGNNELKFKDNYNIETVKNNIAKSAPNSMQEVNQLPENKADGIKQTSNSGQCFTVSKEGSFLPSNNAKLVSGDNPGDHNTRLMVTMIDMVKTEVTRGDILKFEGDPYMVAAGVLFAQKLSADPYNLSLDIKPPPPIENSNIDPEIIQKARELVNKVPNLESEQFLEKAQEFQASLQNSSQPTI